MANRGNISTEEVKNNPHFFKFFLPTINDHALRIPWEFLKHMESKYFGTVSLIGPNRNIWLVELNESTDGVFLQNGWHEFVRDHSLQVGYCLVFRYDGNMHFNVKVFDTSACNKDYACNVKSCNDSIGFGDNNKRKHGDNAVKVFHGYPYNACKGSFKNPRGENNHPVITLAPRTQLESRHPLWRKPHGTTEKNIEKSGLKVQPSPLLENKVEKNHQSRKAVIKRHQNALISKRRHVGEQGVTSTLKMALSFESKNHFAAVVMQKTYVCVRFFMTFPRDFMRLALPKVTKIITLYCPNRKAWKAKYVYSGYRAALSSGWRSFVVGNKLTEGDVCVFEAITENKFQVHIFRGERKKK